MSEMAVKCHSSTFWVPPMGTCGPRTALWRLVHLILLSAHAWEGGGWRPPAPRHSRWSSLRLAEVILGWRDNTSESGTVRGWGKWHKNPDKWRSLRWKPTSTGCFLFCLFLYQVSSLPLCLLMMLSSLVSVLTGLVVTTSLTNLNVHSLNQKTL